MVNIFQQTIIMYELFYVINYTVQHNCMLFILQGTVVSVEKWSLESDDQLNHQNKCWHVYKPRICWNFTFLYVTSLFWQHGAYSLVRLKHEIVLFRVRKIWYFGLKHLVFTSIPTRFLVKNVFAFFFLLWQSWPENVCGVLNVAIKNMGQIFFF